MGRQWRQWCKGVTLGRRSSEISGQRDDGGKLFGQASKREGDSGRGGRVRLASSKGGGRSSRRLKKEQRERVMEVGEEG